MKKIGLVLILAFAIAFANAQDNKTTTTTTTTKTSVTRPPVSRTQVAVADLPKLIQDDLTKNWAGYTTKQAFKVDKSSIITYKLFIEKDTVQMALTYNADGKFENSKPISKKALATKSVTPAIKTNTDGIKQDTIKK
jgi:hypothetical protein